MGKYIKKGKIKRKVQAMEISLGVRTRAKSKTLALNKPKNSAIKMHSSSLSRSSSSSTSSKSPSCYLQLRNRRLVRCIELKSKKRCSKIGKAKAVCSANEVKRMEIEVSFGENFGEFEGRSCRNSRETTPCSLIRRDSEHLATPGSTTRAASTTARNMTNIQSSFRRNIPTSREMEEFFAAPEERQRKEFIEKYNFDPVKDCPIPGRFEWVRLRN